MKKIVSGFLLAALMVTGTSVSAEEAETVIEPGVTQDQFLYSFDQFLEELQLFITTDDEKEAQLLLEFAEERISEAYALTEEDKADFVEEAVSDYLELLQGAQEKITEAIAVEESGDFSPVELTDKLEEVSELPAEIDVELEEDAQTELEEKVTEAKLVAAVVRDLDRDQVVKLRESGLGYGQIAHVFLLAEASGKSVEEVSVLFRSGEDIGFGEAAKQLGLHPADIKGKGKAAKRVLADQPEDENGTEADQDVPESNMETEEAEVVTPETGNTESDLSTEEAEAPAVQEEQAGISTANSKQVPVKKPEDNQEGLKKAAQKKAEAARKAAEKQAEAAKKAAEKQAEAVKKAAEQQAEEAKKAAEEQAEALKKAAEKQAEALKKSEEKKQEALKDAAEASKKAEEKQKAKKDDTEE